MKRKPAPIASRQVVVSRPGQEPIAYTIAPLPIGYSQWLETVYPAPVRFLNGEPVADSTKRANWSLEVNLMCIAKSLGDEMEAQPPAVAGDVKAWSDYAAAVRAEFGAAGLLDGELADFMTAINAMLRGSVALGKA